MEWLHFGWFLLVLWIVRRANFPQAFAWHKLEVPSQIDTNNPAHACAGSLTWVRNKPSHIAASYHLWHSQGRRVCISRCNRNSLNKFGFNAFLKEFPSVTMVLPLLLSHCPPPKLTSQVSSMATYVFSTSVTLILISSDVILDLANVLIRVSSSKMLPYIDK